MVSLVEDQAAGLRRLFARAKEPVAVAFAGARGAAGRPGVVAGLARGLAAAGKEVIVVDETCGPDSVAAAFGVASRFDLLQAVNGDVPGDSVVLRVAPAVRLVPAARAAREAGRSDNLQRRAVAEWLRRLQKEADFVLVDTAGRGDGELSPLVPAPQRVIVVTAASQLAITEAYAQIKRLAQGYGRHGFEVIVARATGPEEGETVFANLREVARRHLGAALEPLGCLPAGGAIQPACNALAETLLRVRRPAAAPGGEGGGVRWPAFAGGLGKAVAANPVV